MKWLTTVRIDHGVVISKSIVAAPPDEPIIESVHDPGTLLGPGIRHVAAAAADRSISSGFHGPSRMTGRRFGRRMSEVCSGSGWPCQSAETTGVPSRSTAGG